MNEILQSWNTLIYEFLKMPTSLAQQRGLVEAKDSLQLVAVLCAVVAKEEIEKELTVEEYTEFKELYETLLKMPFSGEGTKIVDPTKRFEVSTRLLGLAITAIKRAEKRKVIDLVDTELIEYPVELAELFERFEGEKSDSKA